MCVLIVMGMSSGIGFVVVCWIVLEGVMVVLGGCCVDVGEVVVREFGGVFVVGDLIEEVGVIVLVEVVMMRFSCLDGVFNNAGGGGCVGLLVEFSADVWVAELA